jgi:aspartyl-tRNA synthetase
MTGAKSLREVIAFPKNKAAASLMDGSPSEVSQKQLDELEIILTSIKEE